MNITPSGNTAAALQIRPAEPADIPAITAIYDAIHTQEERGEVTIGWDRAIYPTRATAEAALQAGDLFAAELQGRVVAAMRLNQEQVDSYAEGSWEFPARDDQVMVMHTLVVDPACARQGIAGQMVRYYEDYALQQGCPYLRIDTNERNTRARAMYRKLGYKEISIVPCVFNGIPGVGLVLLEKKL